ncbi:20975_t:CDS:2 [Entrophospora sp. SA101]|nr:20975_t:CDS:2 [Entrophospora sp. SA101]CAJ0842091.1 10742_t:CDS:2 [Entrophospora sp. SA101]
MAATISNAEAFLEVQKIQKHGTGLEIFSLNDTGLYIDEEKLGKYRQAKQLYDKIIQLDGTPKNDINKLDPKLVKELINKSQKWEEIKNITNIPKDNRGKDNIEIAKLEKVIENSQELTRINQDIIAEIKKNTGLPNLIQLDAVDNQEKLNPTELADIKKKVDHYKDLVADAANAADIVTGDKLDNAKINDLRTRSSELTTAKATIANYERAVKAQLTWTGHSAPAQVSPDTVKDELIAKLKYDSLNDQVNTVRQELTLNHPSGSTNLTNPLIKDNLAPFKKAKTLSEAPATATDWDNLLRLDDLKTQATDYQTLVDTNNGANNHPNLISNGKISQTKIDALNQTAAGHGTAVNTALQDQIDEYQNKLKTLLQDFAAAVESDDD